eukprot:Pgem_evm1s2336
MVLTHWRLVYEFSDNQTSYIFFTVGWGLFIIEQVVLIILTRKSWSLFCDFGLNIRLLIFFILPYVFDCVIRFHYMRNAIDVGGVFVSYLNYICISILGYLFDSFFLIFVKLISQQFGYGALEKLSMVAQKEFDENDVLNIVQDEELYPYLLQTAKENYCQENVFTEVFDSENGLNTIKREALIHLLKNYITPDSEYELNLAYNDTKMLLTWLDELEDELESSQLKLEDLESDEVFPKLRTAEIHIINSIISNFFNVFKENQEVKNILKVRAKDKRITSNLQNMGLLKDQTTSTRKSIASMDELVLA